MWKRKNTPNSLYISCDFLDKNANLFEIINDLNKTYNITTFYLDEIHFINQREKFLKNIYDILDVSIIFSGSNMIDIVRGGYDLSRRVLIYTMPIFSFGEFIILSKKIKINNFDFGNLLKNHIKISTKNSIRYTRQLLEQYFQYWQFGYWYQEKDIILYQKRLNMSIRKMIYEDIPMLIKWSVKTTKIEEILQFLAISWTSNNSTNSIAKKVWLSINTVDLYLSLLEKLWIICRLSHDWNISDNLRKSKKTFILYPNIINLRQNKIWCIRESYFVSNLLREFDKNNLFYTDKWQIDIILKNNWNITKFEIWWNNKKSQKNIYTIKDNIQVSENENTIPLRIFWLLW